MMLRHCIFGVMALCFTVSPLLADEVLYCTDTDATGFKWDKNGAVSPRHFVEERFTVKIVSDSLRLITPSAGDAAGMSLELSCARPLPYGMPDRTVCNNQLSEEMWVFFRNTYTRSYLFFAPPAGGDQNILVAYGTCTKF